MNNHTLLRLLGFAFTPDPNIKSEYHTWRRPLDGDACLSAGTGEDGWGEVPATGPFNIYHLGADGEVTAWQLAPA